MVKISSYEIATWNPFFFKYFNISKLLHHFVAMGYTDVGLARNNWAMQRSVIGYWGVIWCVHLIMGYWLDSSSNLHRSGSWCTLSHLRMNLGNCKILYNETSVKEVLFCKGSFFSSFMVSWLLNFTKWRCVLALLIFWASFHSFCITFVYYFVCPCKSHYSWGSSQGF